MIREGLHVVTITLLRTDLHRAGSRVDLHRDDTCRPRHPFQ